MMAQETPPARKGRPPLNPLKHVPKDKRRGGGGYPKEFRAKVIEHLKQSKDPHVTARRFDVAVSSVRYWTRNGTARQATDMPPKRQYTCYTCGETVNSRSSLGGHAAKHRREGVIAPQHHLNSNSHAHKRSVKREWRARKAQEAGETGVNFARKPLGLIDQRLDFNQFFHGLRVQITQDVLREVRTMFKRLAS